MLQIHEKIRQARLSAGLTEDEMAEKLGISRSTYQYWEKKTPKIDKVLKVAQALGLPSEYFFGDEDENKPTYLQERQGKKNQDVAFLVPLVSIPAQAGYVKSYDQIDFVKKLEKYPIVPGVDHHGAEWLYFTVAGDSMEPEIRDGDVILASRVHVDDWPEIKNYHTHVVVTDNELWIKDLYRLNQKQWILLSQNPTVKPFRIQVESIKQLWVMRRHIRNRVPKKEFYDIEEIKKSFD